MENHIVIMDTDTYKSIGKPITKCTNIIISRNKKQKIPSCVFVYPSLDKVIDEYYHINHAERELWILPGKSTIKEGLIYANRIYSTLNERKALVEFDLTEWKMRDYDGYLIYDKI